MDMALITVRPLIILRHVIILYFCFKLGNIFLNVQLTSINSMNTGKLLSDHPLANVIDSRPRKKIDLFLVDQQAYGLRTNRHSFCSEQ